MNLHGPPVQPPPAGCTYRPNDWTLCTPCWVASGGRLRAHGTDEWRRYLIRRRRCGEAKGYDSWRRTQRRCGGPAVLWWLGKGSARPLCAACARRLLAQPRGRWGLPKSGKLLTDAELPGDAVDLYSDEDERTLWALAQLPEAHRQGGTTTV